MADYLTRFSFMIPATTEAEREWAAELVDAIERNDDDPPPIVKAVFGDDIDGLYFELEMQDDGLWVHSDDTGSVDQVIALVQYFLSRFRPITAIGFSWAYTCSKPRVDSFGGGAAYVTATRVAHVNTTVWLAAQAEQGPAR
jgi:hypothetical protein